MKNTKLVEYVVYNEEHKKFVVWSGRRTHYYLTTVDRAVKQQAFDTAANAQGFIDLIKNRHDGAQTWIYDGVADRLVYVKLNTLTFRAVEVQQTYKVCAIMAQ